MPDLPSRPEQAPRSGEIFHGLHAFRPQIVWVLDVAFSGVIATWIASFLGLFAWVIDAGDPIVEFGRSRRRGPAGMMLTWMLDAADRLVLAGRVRFAGLLPLHLAASKFNLASDVGEASLVLSTEMRLAFEGVRDPAHPSKIAERVRAVLADPEILRLGQEGHASPSSTSTCPCSGSARGASSAVFDS